jgi:hypothetical protein
LHVLACLCTIASPASALSQSAEPIAPPRDTLRLANGTVLVGRITSASDGKVRIVVDAMGEVTVDSGAITLAASPPAVAPPKAGRRSPWSGTLSASGSYVSELASGVVGSTFGMQILAGVARTTPTGAVTLDGTLGYWRVEPDAAALDQWGLSLGWRHDIAPRVPMLAKSIVDVNRVQTLKYRSTTVAGIGYVFVKTTKVSLTAAPGLGFVKSEQTEQGRVLSFAAGKVPGVEGMAWGAHEMVTLQLTPTLGLQHNALWLRGFAAPAYGQLQLDARLTAMVMKHVGLLVVFVQQYDSSMPPPVNKTIRTLNPGVQLTF